MRIDEIVEVSLHDDMSADLPGCFVKAKFFHGLSDPARLTILELLAQGELTVGDLVARTKQTQSNTSNHLRCLLECGLVQRRREGRYIWYRLKDDDTRALLVLSERVVAKVHHHIVACLPYKFRRYNG